MDIDNYKIRLSPIFINEIIYNLKLLYINVNEYETFNDPLIISLQNLIKVNSDNLLLYYYNEYKFYKLNDIYYTVLDNKIISETDINYLGFNNIISNSKIIILLNSISKIVNSISIQYKKTIEITNSDAIIKIYNSEHNIIKIISLSFFYYSKNNLLHLKQIWEFFNNIDQINILLNNILLIINYFNSLKKIII